MKWPQHRDEPTLRVPLRRKLLHIVVVTKQLLLFGFDRRGVGDGGASTFGCRWLCVFGRCCRRTGASQVGCRDVSYPLGALLRRRVNPGPVGGGDLAGRQKGGVRLVEDDKLGKDVLLLLKVLFEGAEDGGAEVGGLVGRDGGGSAAGEAINGALQGRAEGCGGRCWGRWWRVGCGFAWSQRLLRRLLVMQWLLGRRLRLMRQVLVRLFPGLLLWQGLPRALDKLLLLELKLLWLLVWHCGSRQGIE